LSLGVHSKHYKPLKKATIKIDETEQMSVKAKKTMMDKYNFLFLIVESLSTVNLFKYFLCKNIKNK
jgi:hypothetical protein